MEKRINLIPSEMAVPPKAVRVVKLITKISTFGAILLFILIVSAISAFIYFKLEHDKLQANVESLKTQITNLEKSEQRLVLAKDRLAKIESIKKYPSIKEDMENFQEISTLLDTVSGSSLVEANILPTRTEFVVTSQDSGSLTAFLNPIYKLTVFKNILLSSLGFGQTTGFMSNVIIKDNE